MNMQASIKEILEDYKQGKMIILMDDENRENEGDLLIASEKVTKEDINKANELFDEIDFWHKPVSWALTALPKTSPFSNITSPIFRPILYKILLSSESYFSLLLICFCISTPPSTADEAEGNVARKPSPVFLTTFPLYW